MEAFFVLKKDFLKCYYYSGMVELSNIGKLTLKIGTLLGIPVFNVKNIVRNLSNPS